ncbi:hypothetical protein [Candidatus Chloroploca asiatica]|uniref:hypothetical protein n=1 Tax=Candidatus Chloroploca asiatica TaxID=1506545 RepID=UPI00155A032A|nr:hypothetical protein [Candidatus Chloroploca asiatica]
MLFEHILKTFAPLRLCVKKSGSLKTFAPLRLCVKNQASSENRASSESMSAKQ